MCYWYTISDLWVYTCVTLSKDDVEVGDYCSLNFDAVLFSCDQFSYWNIKLALSIFLIYVFRVISSCTETLN